jgi:hypothetical protein
MLPCPPPNEQGSDFPHKGAMRKGPATPMVCTTAPHFLSFPPILSPPLFFLATVYPWYPALKKYVPIWTDIYMTNKPMYRPELWSETHACTHTHTHTQITSSRIGPWQYVSLPMSLLSTEDILLIYNVFPVVKED